MKSTLYIKAFFFLLALPVLAGFSSCASQGATQAEEYFSIGMAYFEMGKFAEAEMWLNRARAADKTMFASEYNLGRIAYETGRYEDAVKYFETILKSDPDNVMALKAAAYSRIKNGDLEKAESLYSRVLELIPESADDGFNYALVLYGMEKYEDCEAVLNKYPFALEEKAPSVLLLARAQRAMKKVEAVDTYAKWTLVNTSSANAQGLYEFAQVLEEAGLNARALEQYDEAIEALTKDTESLKKSTIRFEKARLLLTEDPENADGMTEFNTAITEGFSDTDAIEALIQDTRITQYNKDDLIRALQKINNEETEEDKKDEEETEESETTEES